MQTVIDFTVVALNAIDVPAPSMPPGSDKLRIVLAWILGLAGFGGIVGLVVVGVKMMLSHRQGHAASEPMTGLAYVFGGLAIVGSAGAIVTVFLG